MREKMWIEICEGQQNKIDDLEFKLAFYEERQSNSMKRLLEELTAKRRETIEFYKKEYDENSVLRASQIENQKKEDKACE